MRLRELCQVFAVDLARHLHHQARGPFVRVLVRGEVQIVLRVDARLGDMAVNATHTQLLREAHHQLDQLWNRDLRRQHL